MRGTSILDQSCTGGGGDKWSDSGYTLKMESNRIFWQIICKMQEKQRSRDDSKAVGLSS